MTLELLTAIATIGTFVVIACGTAAALIQLTHLRTSNQLQAIIALGHELQDTAPYASFVNGDLPRKMEDPQFRKEIGVVIDPERHPELIVALFNDRFGLLVKLGLMPESFVLELGGGADAILKAWTNLEEVIAIRRRDSPNAYQNFEFLAMRAQKWLKRFPRGNYPSNEPRMELIDRHKPAKPGVGASSNEKNQLP